MAALTVHIVFLCSILLLPLVSTGEAAQLRYVTSIYTDVEGTGLNRPEDVACNTANIVVADTGNGRLLRYALDDASVKPEGEIKADRLTNPIKVQMNSSGEIFVLDGMERQVARLGADGAFKGFVEPTGLLSPKEYVVKSFTLDGEDNLYLLDIFSERVVKLDADGNYLGQVPFPEEYGFFADLTVDSKGDILLVDSVKSMAFSSPKGSDAFTALSDSLKDYMNFPTDIAVDGKGAIYLVDQNGSGIVLLGQDGSYQGRQLGMGWTESLLYYPTQMCVNADMDFFIADRNNNRVQVFRAAE